MQISIREGCLGAVSYGRTFSFHIDYVRASSNMFQSLRTDRLYGKRGKL